MLTDTELYLANGGTIIEVPGFNWKPYRETPRKQEPEWAARKAIRDKAKIRDARGVPKGMINAPEVMAIYGCDPTASGYRRFTLMMEKDEVPQPDHMRPAGKGNFMRYWFPATVENHRKRKAIVEHV